MADDQGSCDPACISRAVGAGAFAYLLWWLLRTRGSGVAVAKTLEKYPELGQAEGRYLADLGRQAIRAGQRVSEIMSSESIPLETIPVVPDLFGELPLGRRVRADVQVTYERPDGTERRVSLPIEGVEVPSLDSIAFEIMAQMSGGIEPTYLRRIERALGGPIIVREIIVLSVERLF